jgi:UDP-2,4-diacetamido-2,4,6-trideoxy-beta-L-altropyranose hydrolase
LAEVLQARGANCAFISVAGTSSVAPALARSGLPVFDLDQQHAIDEATVGGSFDAIVFDSYDLDAVQERAASRLARRRMVIDDLANRSHDCDLLIDPTWGRAADDYEPWVHGARLLLGPAYALLRPRFAELRPSALRRRATFEGVRRVLVTFGLSDPGELTLPVAEALLSAGSYRLDVVVPRNTGSWEGLEKIAAMDDRLSLFDDPPDMAALIAHADVVVGAGGGTSWERCCLGAPSIVFVVADNQVGNARALSEAGAAWVVPVDGWPGELARALCSFQDAAWVREMSRRAASLCDGEGASRVAEVMLEMMNDDPGPTG